MLFALLVSVSLFACNNESAKREKIESDNVTFYTHVWEVAINEGRINQFYYEKTSL